jgi:predicted acyltransferase
VNGRILSPPPGRPKAGDIASGDRSPYPAAGGRLVSLDAFRGFAIASMLLVNNPGDWGNVYAPLLHAKWHGWTITDWVFPFFVFISGMAMAISLARRAQEGADKTGLLLTTARRALLIIGIGLALNLIPHWRRRPSSSGRAGAAPRCGRWR